MKIDISEHKLAHEKIAVCRNRKVNLVREKKKKKCHPRLSLAVGCFQCLLPFSNLQKFLYLFGIYVLFEGLESK